MRYLENFELFEKALRPSLFRRYVKNFNKERYADFFNFYKEKYDGDKNAYRIYLPINTKYTKRESKEKIEIEKFLNQHDYEVIDYIEGQCKHKRAKNPAKIGQTLTKIGSKSTDSSVKSKAEELMKKFVEDPIRKSVAESDLLICVSRHPYDIAGSDTDRNWTNCMTLPHIRTNAPDPGKEIHKLKIRKGELELAIKEIEDFKGGRQNAFKYFDVTKEEYDKMRNEYDRIDGKIEKLKEEEESRTETGNHSNYIMSDVKEGSLIAYLIKKNDKNINNPLKNMNIKPYLDSANPKDFVLVADRTAYPTDKTNPEFKETLNDWLEEVNQDKNGKFRLHPSLYDDSEYGEVVKVGREFKDVKGKLIRTYKQDPRQYEGEPWPEDDEEEEQEDDRESRIDEIENMPLSRIIDTYGIRVVLDSMTGDDQRRFLNDKRSDEKDDLRDNFTDLYDDSKVLLDYIIRNTSHDRLFTSETFVNGVIEEMEDDDQEKINKLKKGGEAWKKIMNHNLDEYDYDDVFDSDDCKTIMSDVGIIGQFLDREAEKKVTSVEGWLKNNGYLNRGDEVANADGLADQIDNYVDDRQIAENIVDNE